MSQNRCQVPQFIPQSTGATTEMTRLKLLSHNSDPAGTRTQDLRIKSPLLYQLSYRVIQRRHRPRGCPSWPIVAL